MERLTLACGGTAMNTLEDMDESILGYAGIVYEYVLRENKFTFMEKCKNPPSVTILTKGPNKHTLMPSQTQGQRYFPEYSWAGDEAARQDDLHVCG